jgi:hypothetical protein
MLDEMESAPVVVRPSAYWELLNARNFDQLAGAGFEEFKRTVNRNYFNWVPTSPLDEQFRAVARAWLRRPVRAVGRARLADTEGLDFLPGQARRATHALFLALLWEAVRRACRPSARPSPCTIAAARSARTCATRCTR